MRRKQMRQEESCETQRKILFILVTREYINNYLYTDSLLETAESHRVTVLIPSIYAEMIPAEREYKVELLSNKVFLENEKKFYFFADVLRWKYRNRSKSFKYREKRSTNANIAQLINQFSHANTKAGTKARELQAIFLSKIKISTKRETIKYYKPIKFLIISLLMTIIFTKNLFFLIRDSVRIIYLRYLARVLSNKFFFVVMEKHTETKLLTPEPLKKFLRKGEFDIVVLPSAAFEPTVVHLVKAKDEIQFKLLLIADNWDNLSSKTVLWKKPDYVATWGPQSSNHAVNIQGISRSRVFEIGTARLSRYVVERGKKMQAERVGPYVLFVGTFLKFDEYQCLKILDEEITTNEKIYGNLRIIYRPHPFTASFESNPIHTLRNIVLDDEIVNFKSNSSNNLLNFDKSMNLQKNAKFVIGGLTSMLIESSILGKNYLGIVHREKSRLTSPHIVYKSYEHFVGIHTLPNLYLSENLSHLSRLFRELFLKEDPLQDEIDKNLAFFYDLSPTKFSEKIKDVIEKMEI
jgi:hypothetical protein